MKQLMTFLVMAFALQCIAITGCSKNSGPPLYPVRGSVVFKGEPAVGARVAFVPVDEAESKPAWAVVDESGDFQVATLTRFDGAQTGKYYVTISWIKPLKPHSNDTDYTDELLPKKYQSPQDSGLVVEVKPEPNELEPFELN